MSRSRTKTRVRTFDDGSFELETDQPVAVIEFGPFRKIYIGPRQRRPRWYFATALAVRGVALYLAKITIGCIALLLLSASAVH